MESGKSLGGAWESLGGAWVEPGRSLGGAWQSKSKAFCVAPYGRESKSNAFCVAPYLYLNTVRPVAIVPFQNEGSGAIYARICNISLLKCSIPGHGRLGNVAARREGRGL